MKERRRWREKIRSTDREGGKGAGGKMRREVETKEEAAMKTGCGMKENVTGTERPRKGQKQGRKEEEQKRRKQNRT